jgi:hypothetical protein
MEEQSATRRVLVAVVEVRRLRGRLKLRWRHGVMEDGVMEDGVMEDAVMEDGVMEDGVMEDGVMEDGVMEDGVMEDGGMEDARKLGEKNIMNAARNRASWQKLLK